MSQNITVSCRRSASRPGPTRPGLSGGAGAVAALAPARSAIARLQPLAVAKRYPELSEVGLAEIGQDVEVDVMLGEQLGVALQTYRPEPFLDLGVMRNPPDARRSLARFDGNA